MYIKIDTNQLPDHFPKNNHLFLCILNIDYWYFCSRRWRPYRLIASCLSTFLWQDKFQATVDQDYRIRAGFFRSFSALQLLTLSIALLRYYINCNQKPKFNSNYFKFFVFALTCLQPLANKNKYSTRSEHKHLVKIILRFTSQQSKSWRVGLILCSISWRFAATSGNN